ncbi:hypothetical protein ACIBO2_36945 [Nonomuraea sp. NPDC050022]|uniref:hypothetical protein n=1 Tax=unclassified Nonomuraea TaxID=2593643 RepID=UPI0033EAD475
MEFIASAIESVAGAARRPVDECHWQALLKDGVERAGIAMDDALGGGCQGVSGGRLVQVSEHPASEGVCAGCSLRGMVGGVPRDETQYVPAVFVDAEVVRRMRVAEGLQVGQHPGGECSAPIASAAHRVANAHDLQRIVSAG